jgi:two-component system cell cycle sensor histidine kinase/response regulator CckA
MATILIVDDGQTNRELLTTLLGYQHHTTVEAADGAEGLERAREIHPDLIISDILMPTMDGYEFARLLREDPAIAATPVIFYSAHYLLREAGLLAAKCGVQYVVPKPVEPEELLRTVDAALAQAAARGIPLPVENFDREHIRVLTNKLSQQAEELQDLNGRLEALIEIGHELNVSQDPSCLVERYCKAARKVVGAACASVCITSASPGDCFSTGLPSSGGACGWSACGATGSLSERLASQVCRAGRECTEGASDPASPATPAVGSYLVVPILTRNRDYGWLGVGRKVANPGFTGDDERLLMTLAAQLAVSYENAGLFDELKRRAEDLEHEVVERRQSVEKYRMVVEQASDGIAIADERGDYLEVNPKMLDMLGYTREQFLKLNMQDLAPKEDGVRDLIPFEQLRSGKGFRKEHRLVRHDGNLIEVEISMSRLEDGRVQALVRDVADRKRLESELRQSQKLEAVGRLAGGVAHDFNNLLTVILGHSDLALAMPDLNEKRRRDIEDIREAGGRAAVLTSQLLAFSRKQVLQPKVLSVSAAVANLTKMLARLIHSNIEVVTQLDGDLWRAKVDPGQLDQVILNLALNARDAMPLGGKLMIETGNRHFEGEQIGLQAEVPPGDYVMLAVSDTGSGMDAETRSHIFEPFFTTKALGRGTGLGLSTVYGIVRQSGGHIWVFSEPGHGTTMKIYFPRVLEASEAVRPCDKNAPLPVGCETVLIAEDEERVRSLVAAVLAQQGYKVIEACDGQEAIEVARQYSGEIQLLFSDVMMPKMSGPDLAAQIRRERPGIKVLLSSGYTGDAAMQQGVLDASTPFLQKPFSAHALAIKVREALDAGDSPALPGLPVGAERSHADDGGLRFPV